MKKYLTQTIYNREVLSEIDFCYCAYCKRKIKTVEIEEWTDDTLTAICPHCKVDAIIPDTKENDINKDKLEKIHNFLFKK